MVKRRKVNKNKLLKDSPSEKRIRDKDGDIAIARGRFAGALKGIYDKSIEDAEEIEAANSLNQLSMAKKMKWDPPLINNNKKIMKSNDSEDHQSYFMKLFDRSVDLAQFDINTPLYPVCRAWIQNKPISIKKKEDESGLVEIKHENNEDNQMFELQEKPVQVEETDVFCLPPPKPLPRGVTTLRIPSPIPHEIEEINLNPNPDQIPSREELLQSHLKKWTQVRKKWKSACLKNEERYAASKEILTRMLERSQTQFQLPVS